MRQTRVALGIVLVVLAWELVGAARSLLAPECTLEACPDLRWRSATTGATAALVAGLLLLVAPRLGRRAWLLAPLALAALYPLAQRLLFFQVANVRCGVVDDIMRDTACAHPNVWLVPGLFALVLCITMLVRAAWEPSRDHLGALTRLALVAGGITSLLMAAVVGAVSRFHPVAGPSAAMLAGMGMLLVAIAGAWVLLPRQFKR